MTLPRRVLLTVALALPASATLLPPLFAENRLTPEMDLRIRAAMDAIIRMDFERAEAELHSLQALDPDHPYSYFGLAGVAWVRYVHGTEQADPSLLGTIEERIEESFRRSRARLKIYPNDAESLIARGATHGLKARMLLTRAGWPNWRARRGLMSWVEFHDVGVAVKEVHEPDH